jgi:hypothetical protein
MDNFVAYLDESGGHGFDFSKEGTSTHFVICAILIDEQSEAYISEEFNKIKSKYFPVSELKSSKLAKSDSNRRKILFDLEPLDFKYYCLIIDKRQILPDTGLQYKEVFYKFLYGILYNNLFRTFRNLSIIADEMISDEFLKGFKNYVQKNHAVDLFHQSKFDFKNGKHTVLLQLADLIGGTINRNYSGKSTISIKDYLPNKFLGEIIWPQNYKPFTVDESEIVDEYKEIIANLALLRIESYLNKNTNSKEPNIKKRVYFLNYIKSIYLYNSKTRFIYTDEIVRHIENLTGDKVKEQYFRQQIIGPLRTEGVLISSNSNGYKVPCSTSDIYSFFNLSSRIIHPMLERLKTAQIALTQATNGKLNILDKPEYEYLKKIIE